MKTDLSVRAVHQGGMRVETSDENFQVLMDYPMEAGETGVGMTPLTMLLASLAACSLNSVMVILKKMQQPVTGLEVEARGTRRTEHPTLLTDISLEFTIKCDCVEDQAVARALLMSEERLCPVWNMLKASTAIKAVFHIEGMMEPAVAHGDLIR